MVVRAQGSCVGHTFEQLKFMIDLVDDKSRIGVCLDTCHLFAAGAPMSVPKQGRGWSHSGSLCVQVAHWRRPGHLQPDRRRCA